MKNTVTLCLALLAYMVLNAQSYNVIRDHNTNKYGLEDANGTVYISPQYDLLYKLNPKLYLARLGSYYGLVTERNVTAHPFEWDGMAQIGGTKRTYRVRQKNKFGLVSAAGLLPVEYDDISLYATGDVHFIMVTKKDKVGYVDTLGHVRIPLQYDKGGFLIKNLVPVQRGNKYGLVDTLNRQVLPFTYDCCFRYLTKGSPVLTARQGNKEGLVDIKGNIIQPIEYDKVWPTGFNYYFLLEKEKKYFVVDSMGKMLSAMAYDTTVTFLWSHLWVKKYGRWGAIDSTGKQKIGLIYDYIVKPDNNRMPVMGDRKWGFLDEKLNERVPLIYDWVSGFFKERAWVRLNNRFGIIDTDGTIVEPIKLDAIEFTDDDYVVFKINNRLGVFHRNGRLISPAQFDVIGYSDSKKLFQYPGFTPVILNDKMGMMSKEGNMLLKTEWYSILHSGIDFLAMKTKGDRTIFVYDGQGKFKKTHVLNDSQVRDFNRN